MTELCSEYQSTALFIAFLFVCFTVMGIASSKSLHSQQSEENTPGVFGTLIGNFYMKYSACHAHMVRRYACVHKAFRSP